jgi:hypothetical protein
MKTFLVVLIALLALLTAETASTALAQSGKPTWYDANTPPVRKRCLPRWPAPASPIFSLDMDCRAGAPRR